MAAEKKTEDPGPSVKDPEVYEAVRDDGASKEKAARIANAAAASSRSDVGERGGEAENYEDRTVDELRDVIDRTVAVAELGFRLPTGIATGTGTDCIAVAAPEGDIAFAGMHTAVGVAAGRAVYDAVRAGGAYWMKHVRRGAA